MHWLDGNRARELMDDRMAALVLRNGFVRGEAQSLVAVLAPPAGVRRRTIVRINDVAGRAAARAIIARSDRSSPGSRAADRAAAFFAGRGKPDRCGSACRGRARTSGASVCRAARRAVGMPSCNCFSPPFSKMRRMFPGLLRLKRGSGSRNGRMPCSLRVLRRDRRVVDQPQRRAIGAVGLAEAVILQIERRRCCRAPRPRASRRGSSCCDRRCG